jgi:signal transduction histidine kinase
MPLVMVIERAHADRMSRIQSLPTWLAGLGYILSYVALAWLSIATSSAPFGIVAWSPETGLSFAAFLIFGNSFWPYLIASAALANLILHGSAFPLLYHILNPVIVGGGYALVLSWVQSSRWQFDVSLKTLRDVLVLETTAILSATAVACACVLLLVECRLLSTSDMGFDMFRSAVGDLIGISIVAPFLLMFASTGRIRKPTREAILQGLSIVAALVFAFSFTNLPHFRLFNVMFFPIIWIALRSGLEGATYGLVVTQIGLILALQLSGPQSAGVTTYQALMLVLAFTGLAIGGLVTERRRFDQDLRLNQESVAHIFRLGSAGELTTAIAHEINQPLTAISNYARFIQRYLEREDGDKRSALEAAAKMTEQVDRTAAVIKNLRDLIRLGRRQIGQQNVHVLIREALDLLEPNLLRTSISVKVSIARDIWEVMVDRLQIEQVFMNIISNAIDAINDAGSYERLIIVEGINLPDGRVEIVIRDSGPGFPEDFNFRQSGIRSSSKREGLGVGLSLSRTIVEGHGGELLLGGDKRGAVVQIRLKAFAPEMHK